MKRWPSRVVLSLCLFIPISATAVQNSTPGANADPFYTQLRHVQVKPEAYAVQNLKLVRDIGTFELKSGVICLLQPVNGMVTGAIFRGDGEFHLLSNDPREQNQMRTLTKADGIDETFEKMVLRFADGTPEEWKALPAAPAGTGCDAGLLDENQKYLRTELKENLAARLLQPVLAGKPDGYFAAFFQGKKYGKLHFVIDPQGLPEFHPEEVALFAFDDARGGAWYAGHLLSEARDGWRVKHTNHETGFIKAVHHKIDANIEKNGHLTATTTETVLSHVDGLRVVPFNLLGKLRVSQVKDANGSSLTWIQENKDEDADFFVLLPKSAAKNEQITLTITYSGKDAVHNEGSGNYYPSVREIWYPNTYFGDYATYDMIFTIPKGMTMASTGTRVSEKNENGKNVTEWKSEVPLAVAGFNFGDFKSETANLDKIGLQVTAYVNRDIPDIFKGFLHDTDSNRPGTPGEAWHDSNFTMGTMTTTPMLKKSLAEGVLAVDFYTNYFGPMPYKNLQLTQQTAGNYGQAWPGLVFLPIYYFLDTTQRHQIGRDFSKGQYWTIVEPHEVAHEWWGHSVGFAGYRDQWMSEGFADFSASLFVQYVRNDRKAYEKFWKDLRDQLVDRDQFGHRPVDVGPVTMGYRVSTAKVGGWTGQNVIYPKGAYILNMLRWMMYSQHGDADFKAMMQDLVKTYPNQAITTEDFKAITEKHLTPFMNAAGNGKMDWFFNEWVYGTEIPTYTSTSTATTTSDGKPAIEIRVTQSGVSPSFIMPVPVYYELSDGQIGKMGQLILRGNTTVKQMLPFDKVVPKRLFINYNFDVLSTN